MKDEYMANQVLIMVQAAEAWIEFFEGNHEQALVLMRSSADLESKTDKQSLTPGEVLPAQELLGDLLLKMDEPEKALEAYQLNLTMRPSRFNGIYGAAVAAEDAGDQEKAKRYFEQLIALTGNTNCNRQEIEKAKMFIKEI